MVTVVLSLVCSVLVSGATVILKPRQDENKLVDVQQNILTISGLVKPTEDLSRAEIETYFKSIEPKLVDFRTAKFYTATDVKPDNYDQRKAAKQPGKFRLLPASEDIASIKRQANLGKVYLVKKAGKLRTVVLPLHGYGLWSTMYGFMALDKDLTTVVGMGFYEHGETPGLGGEVDNPRWKAQWLGKQVLDTQGNVDFHVLKGFVDPASPQAIHQVDGLSGATLTSRGVEHLVNFWLGDYGFGPFLANLKKGEA